MKFTRLLRHAGVGARLLCACWLLAAGPARSQAAQGPYTATSYDLHLPLTAQERAYLAGLPPLKAAIDPDWSPYAFVDAQGRFHGISADFLAYVTHTLHITVQRVDSQSWSESVHLANAGQIDLLTAMPQESQLAGSFLSTLPYIDYPEVIVTRVNGRPVADLRQLAGLRVATVEGAGGGAAPGLDTAISFQRILVHSTRDGLAAVADGKAQAFVGDLGVVQRLIQQRYPGVLQVSGATGYSRSLSFGIAPQFEPLRGLMDRVLKAIPAEDRERIQNTWLRTSLVYGIPRQALWEVLTPIGLVIVVSLLVLGLIIVYLRKQIRRRLWTEQELRYRVKFQQSLMAATPVPIFVKDLGGRYLEVNPAFEALTGLKADAIIGRTADDVHRYAESQEQLAALTRQVFASGRAVHGKLAYRSNADRLHDLIYWLQGVQEEGPHPRALLGVLVDVSELRAMEREQRALRRQLVELTQVLPALLFQVRYTPDGKFAPVFISHHARQLTGFSAEALMSSFAQIAACMSPRALRQLMLALRRARRSQLPVEQELVLDGGGGRPLWARLEAVCQRDGDAYIYTGYVIDVTQVKLQTQSLSRAKQEAEQAARVKDVFLATMSHEIRTPMSGLIGVLELMHRAQLPSEDQHLLDMARGAARSLLRILNDVLDFAKSQSGRLSIETRPFSLRAVVDEVAGLFAPDIKRKGLHFDVHVGALVAPAYLGDGQRVAQVLMNLVGNALKFTTEGGIALLVEAQPADAVLGRQEVAITVKDTGIGIDAAEQAMLFEPFVQAGARQQGGTGLGLAICKRLIQAMHGDIQLRSRLGEGTEVQLRLAWPLGSLALEDTEAASERACHATAKTPVAMLDRSILLVEDQPLNRELLGRQLEAVGIKAYDTAANGLEGWQAYVRQVHGLVITDCAMPGMDGEALIRRIRAHEAGTGRRAYLVALTANAVDSQRNACLEAGADEVMLKPMHLPQLRDLLARAFDSARTPSPPELPEGIPAEDWPRLREQLVMHMRQDMQVARARLHEQDWSRARDAVHRIVGTASWFKLADIAGVARTLQLALEEAHAPATLVESLQSAIAAMDAGCRGA